MILRVLNSLVVAMMAGGLIGFVLYGCAHRAVEETVPAKAATSTAAQSAEIAPVVVAAVATGCAAIGIGVALKEPHLATAGAATAGGALALQRCLPWIPWLIAAGAAYMAIRYAIKHHLVAKIGKIS